ncbi:uncharacterized protein DS421_5g159060 [Arachis hypogaea]|nr:uncharacterized protein DS421_5g159060 [Arachis hypogaea]
MRVGGLEQTLAVIHIALRSSLLSSPLLPSTLFFQTISSHKFITVDRHRHLLPLSPSPTTLRSSPLSLDVTTASLYATFQPSPIFTDLRPSALPSDRIQVNRNSHHYHYNYYKMKKA